MPANRLIFEAATGGRQLTPDELQQTVDHMAQVGFDPDAQEDVGGRLVGLSWKGRIVQSGDRLSSAEVHYLRHVVLQKEWPDGTTYEAYLDSLEKVIKDPQSGLLVNQFRDRGWQLTIVGRSGSMRGPAGSEWIMIEYRLSTGHWVTAFQPREGLDYLEMPERSQKLWLRRPR